MSPARKNVDIHTDGACLGNPGPGGWAALLRWRGIERELDVFGRGARRLAEHLASDGRDVVEVLPLDGRHPFAIDEVVVLGLELDRGTSSAGERVGHLRVSSWINDFVATSMGSV